MSYCRWSDMNFQCDVYVYEDAGGGWTTHVAGSRWPQPIPQADMRLLIDGQIFWYMMQSRLSSQAFEMSGKPEPIDLPHAGELFNDETPGECASRLEELRSIGYVVPQYAIDALREEQAEEST